MFKNKSIPFNQDTSKWFLPWITFLMVFISILFISFGIMAYQYLKNWEKGVSQSMTLQIPAYEPDGSKRQEVEKELETALEIFKNYPEIKKAEVIDNEKMKFLMTPWLSSETDIEQLPLPKLIEITLNNPSQFDFDSLAISVQDQLPKAILETHRNFINEAVSLINYVTQFIIIVLLLLLGTLSYTIMYVTCSSLTIHQTVISLIHGMGAKDSFIGFQYAWRNFKFIFLGSGLAYLCILPIVSFVSKISSFPIEMKSLFFLLLIPVFLSIFAFFTTYMTVKKYLRKLL